MKIPELKIIKIADDDRGSPLRQKSKKVTVFDHELRIFIEKMKDICWQNAGSGLSAVQVGRLERIIIYEKKEGVFIAMVNPVIKKSSGHISMTEGCLSLPNKEVVVSRSKEIIVSFQDGRGNHKVKKLVDLKAVIVQHEIDHLKGKLIIDYV